MATPVISKKAASLGLHTGPEGVVLVESTNIDHNADIDFTVVGPCEAVELTIIAGAAVSGTPSVVFTLQRKDLASGSFVNLVASAAVVAQGDTYLLLTHHAAAVANHSIQRVVSENLRLHIAYTGTPATDVLNATTVTALGV